MTKKENDNTKKGMEMFEYRDITKERLDNKRLSDELYEKWTDWKWQLKKTIKDIESVEYILGIKFSEEKKKSIRETMEKFPMAITPYYLSLVNPDDYENDPVFKQAFPNVSELHLSNCDMADPLHEDKDSPVAAITHRYPDRVLFHISNVCAMYCRHCTRKRKVGDVDSIPNKQVIENALDYIRKTPVVRDVLLSGGDPFLLSDEYLDWILAELNKIPHVEVIRIGTRTPVVLPYRITENLLTVLKKYDNIWINTHFNHPKEITKTAIKALKDLAHAGIPLGNQSVLLRGINDCPRIMKKLVHKLVANKVRPYYLYQCDLSEGLSHFRTNVGKGIEILESLRGHTSGFAVPTYVIDAPGGGGKIPVAPNYLISWSTNKVILRNYEGVITTYHMPDEYESVICDNKCDKCDLNCNTDNDERNCDTIGIAKLLCDYEDDICLEPKSLEREERNR